MRGWTRSPYTRTSGAQSFGQDFQSLWVTPALRTGRPGISSRPGVAGWAGGQAAGCWPAGFCRQGLVAWGKGAPASLQSQVLSVASGHPRAFACVGHPPRGASPPSVQASAHRCPRPQPGSCSQPTLGPTGQPLGANPDRPFLYFLASFPLLGWRPPHPRTARYLSEPRPHLPGKVAQELQMNGQETGHHRGQGC